MTACFPVVISTNTNYPYTRRNLLFSQFHHFVRDIIYLLATMELCRD